MKKIDDYTCYTTHIIGKGSFGKVVYGRNNKEEDICFKFEKVSNHKHSSILKEEYKMYKFLEGGTGIPKIFNFGQYNKSNRYLAMELVGPSLDKYFILCDKKFNLETTIFLGLQMIDRIEFVHTRGIIHRDIKPNNFLFGKFTRTMDSNDSTLYIIDFGLSASYIEQVSGFNNNIGNNNSINTGINENLFNINSLKPNTFNSFSLNNENDLFNLVKQPLIYTSFNPVNQIYSGSNGISTTQPKYKHIVIKEGCRFVGTPRYASLNTHQGIRQSRRDDLESIAYILIYFYLGDLPWQGVKAKTKSEKKEKIRQLKFSLKVDEEEMFKQKNLPFELKEFLKFCRKMTYDATPDYNYLRSLLTRLRSRNNFPERPVIFQWEECFLGDKPYNVMKKNYKTLFEGYPTIPVSDYIEFIEKKKNNGNIKNSVDSREISLLETTSELNKSTVENYISGFKINEINLSSKNRKSSNTNKNNYLNLNEDDDRYEQKNGSLEKSRRSSKKLKEDKLSNLKIDIEEGRKTNIIRINIDEINKNDKKRESGQFKIKIPE